jgi:hypothetical protein
VHKRLAFAGSAITESDADDGESNADGAVSRTLPDVFGGSEVI